MTDLLACKTCGCEAAPQLFDEAVEYRNIRAVWYWCSSCGAMSCASRYDPMIQSGKQLAIEKSRDNWNTRASDARIAELEAALRPFAAAAEKVDQNAAAQVEAFGRVPSDSQRGTWGITRGDVLKARAALGEQQP